MKKVFISCPMRGREEKNIKGSMERMFVLAQLAHPDAEMIDSYIEDFPDEAMNDNQKRIWYLSKSIEKLAEADVLISFDGAYNHPGCKVERAVAIEYGIEIIEAPAQIVYAEGELEELIKRSKGVALSRNSLCVSK